MAKPTTLPRWADTVSADPTKLNEPPDAKKDIGWLVSEKPPAQWFNWLFWTVWQWCLWLQGFESTAHSWAAVQSFDFGIIVAQATVNASAILAVGQGTGYGIYATGGANGPGVRGVARGLGNAGVEGYGDMTVAAPGVRGVGGLNGNGGMFSGNGTGPGLIAVGGATGVGAVTQGSGGGAGLQATGNGSGVGVQAAAGATGIGLLAFGGATSGAGVRAQAAAGSASAGVEAVAGTGNAIEATGSIQATGDITSGGDVSATGHLQTLAHDTSHTAPTPAVGNGIIGAGSTVYGWASVGSAALARGRNVLAVSSPATGHYIIRFNHALIDCNGVSYWATSAQAGRRLDYALTSLITGKLQLDLFFIDNTNTSASADFTCGVVGE